MFEYLDHHNLMTKTLTSEVKREVVKISDNEYLVNILYKPIIDNIHITFVVDPDNKPKSF
jgi:hypothetical protein